MSRSIWLESQFPFLPGLEWIDSRALAQSGGLSRLEPYLSVLILILLYEHLRQDTEATSNLVLVVESVSVGFLLVTETLFRKYCPGLQTHGVFAVSALQDQRRGQRSDPPGCLPWC